MKPYSNQAWSRLLLFVFTFSFVVILSSLRKPDVVPTDLSAAEISALVESATKDTKFDEITEIDVKTFLNRLASIKSVDPQKWNELAKKKNFTASEADYIYSVFGFRNADDFKDYIDLLIALARKFGLDKMNPIDQRKFFVELRKKQNELIRKDSLLEKSSKKVSWPSQMPPECWKCVYDYRDCVNGADGDWVVSWSQPTPVKEKIVVWNNISVTIMTSEWSQLSNPNLQLTYVASSSPWTCTGIYQSCISQCATP